MDINREWRERGGRRGGHEDRCEDRAWDARERQQAGKDARPPPCTPHRTPRRGSGGREPSAEPERPGSPRLRPQGQMCGEEPAMGRWTDGRGCPLPTLAPRGVRGWGPDRERSEPAAPGLCICTSAPPVVLATARATILAPAPPESATRCSGRPRAPVPTPAFAHFRFRPVEGNGSGRSRRDSWGAGRAGASLWDGTRSWNLPPAPALRRGKADTTTLSMPRGCWLTPRRPVAQGADGNWSPALFRTQFGFNECTGWAWGARALGCLRRRDRRTPPP